jgi:dihydroflavonol-4-reductase
MTSTIFVSGATGQTGGNVCAQLIERGDHVRAWCETRTKPRR